MIELYCDGHRVPFVAYLRATLEELPIQFLAALGVPPSFAVSYLTLDEET